MPEGNRSAARLLVSERLQIKNRLFQFAFVSLVLSIFFLANTENTDKMEANERILSQDAVAGVSEIWVKDTGEISGGQGLAVGDILLFFHCPDYEWVKISAVKGNHILLAAPLKRGYLSASRVEVMRVSE
ncbi:MAG: hypothetical protein SF052_23600 [Bacteroidia bacterium]|nr:hypothetical protein [Bacteroidia bacterium]